MRFFAAGLAAAAALGFAVARLTVRFAVVFRVVVDFAAPAGFAARRVVFLRVVAFFTAGRAAALGAARLAVVFLAVVFRAVVLRAVVLRAVVLRVVAFFGAADFAAAFFGAARFVVFFAVPVLVVLIMHLRLCV